MKRTNLIFCAVIIMISIISSLAHAKNYVCVDPGHGGSDDGCSGRIYHVNEKLVNFGVGHTAWQYFCLTNYNPLMTRYEDIYMSRGK